MTTEEIHTQLDKICRKEHGLEFTEYNKTHLAIGSIMLFEKLLNKVLASKDKEIEELNSIIKKDQLSFIQRRGVFEAEISALKEYGRQEFNRALDLAAEKAKTKKTGNSGVWYDASVDKDSILNLKIT